jgi:AsmA protein
MHIKLILNKEESMSRLTKISLLIIGIVVVIAIVMAVLVKTLITPEKIRATLVPLTERSLHRKVVLEKIHIGLFSGISLEDLQVRQKVGTDNFIAVKSLDLHYRFLPLLTGKVVIDNIKLVQPQIAVIRQPDGSFNFDDLLGRKFEKGKEKAKISEEAAPPSSAPEKALAGSVLNLLVNSVSISGGQLLFIDRSQPGQAPARYSLDRLSLDARNITLDKSFPVEFSAMFNGAKISLAGAYDIKDRLGNVDLDLQPLDLVNFAPYYRQALPGKLGSGLISLTLKTDLSPNRISVKGKVTLDRLDLMLNGLPEAELKQAKLEIDSSLSYQPDQKLLDFSSLLIKFNNIPVRTVGKVALSGKEPNLTMALFLDHLNLERLNQGLPEGLAKDIRAYGLSGQVNALVELAGKPSSGARLVKKADLRFEDVQANLSGVKAGINGSVEFTGQDLKADKLLLNLGDQPAQLSFDATNLFGESITGNFQFTADTLDFNKLIPVSKEKEAVAGNTEAATDPQAGHQDTGEQSGAAAAPAMGQPAKTGQQEIGPFSIPAEINGKVSINQGTYRQLSLDHLFADIQLKNNHLQITRAGCGLAGGKLNASTDTDLGVKGLAYQGKLDLSKIQLAVLDSGLFPDTGQSVTGVMDSTNTLTGHGTQSPALLKAMQVNGQLMIKDGQISGSPMLIALANFLGNIDLEKLSFTSLQSQYVMRNGVVSLRGALDSSQLKLKPDGTAAIDGPLDLSLNARLSPDAMSRMGSDNNLKQVMTDENGWGLLPLKLEGTLTGPRIALDSKALQKQAVGKAKQELQKQLLKKLSTDKKDQKSNQNKDLLDSTLKRLFGN